ncbi:MAG: ABC transporter permease, partial [Chloroflexi bacterium]|nr:ABC transporter permease [Chloroflexota bacterium]
MWSGIGSYIRRNPTLLVGIIMLVSLALFSAVGSMVYDTNKYRPLSVPPGRPPSWIDPMTAQSEPWRYPLGTDNQGRDLMAVMIAGTPLTIFIGFIAGSIGVVLGTILAFTAAYYGG